MTRRFALKRASRPASFVDDFTSRLPPALTCGMILIGSSNPTNRTDHGER